MTYSNDPSSNARGWDRSDWAGRSCGFARWRPIELAAMIVGFMVFWPLGLAVIAFKVWQKRSGYCGDVFAFAGDRADMAARNWRGFRDQFSSRASGFGGWNFRSTGNAAFDEWRAGEISRLEEERRKLEAAEREFAAHIAELRRARDR